MKKGFRNLKRHHYTPLEKISPLVMSLCTRPQFAYNDKVWVRTLPLLPNTANIMRAKVMGKCEFFDIWDYWLVKLNDYPQESYPYPCIAVRHDCIMPRKSDEKKPKMWKPK